MGQVELFPQASGVGSSAPEVLFILDAPQVTEDAPGIQGADEGGSILQAALQNAPYPYYITLWRGVEELETDLLNLKPKFLVLLGAKVAAGVLGVRKSISALRGSYITTKWGVPCIVTYSPKALLVKLQEGTLEAFSGDIERIPQYLEQGKAFVVIEYYYKESEIYTKFLPKLSNNKESPVSVDIETASTGDILCIAFAWNSVEAHVIQVTIETEDIVQSILSSLSQPIFHNAAYDVMQIKKVWGMWLWDNQSNVEDTIILHAIEEPDQPHGLEHIAAILRPDVGNYKLATSGGESEMEQYPIIEVMKRCAYDVVVTHTIYHKYIDKVNKDIYNALLLANKLLILCMYQGVRIDTTILQRLKEEKTKESVETLEHLQEWAKMYGDDINYNSPSQVADLLYTKMRLPVLSQGKQHGSTDKATMIALATQKLPQDVKKNLDKYTKYLNLKVLLKTTIAGMEKNIRNDRLHTSYKIAGTRTARLSSARPNLQNITEELRECVIPDDGEIFLKLDANQMELRWAGIVSGDRKLTQVYNTPGMDLHNETLQVMQKLGQVKATRLEAKTVNFGMLYLMGAKTLSEQLHISERKAQNLVDAHKEAYEGYWQYVRETENKLLRGEEIVTWWGRKRKFKAEHIRNAVNYPIQSAASDFLVLYMFPKLIATEYGKNVRLTTHDDIVLSLPERKIVQVINYIERIVKEFNMQVPIPMQFDYAVGRNWKDVVKISKELIEEVVK